MKFRFYKYFSLEFQNQPQYPAEMKQQQPPDSVSVSNHPPRHRDETIKDLHAFAQDFKLVPMQQNEQPLPLQGPPPVVEQVSQVMEL